MERIHCYMSLDRAWFGSLSPEHGVNMYMIARMLVNCYCSIGAFQLCKYSGTSFYRHSHITDSTVCLDEKLISFFEINPLRMDTCK